MIGINATTGKHLSGIDHLRQSITDILTTPVGTRVMRRDYGSRIYQLVDAPLNRNTLLELYAATAEALMAWEPRLQLTQVTAEAGDPGSVSLTISGTYLPDGQEIKLDGIVVT